MSKILIIDGPNIDLLSSRNSTHYDTLSYEELKQYTLGQNDIHDIDWIQLSGEGEIVKLINQSCEKYDGLIINPGAYSHYSLAIHDALEIFSKPKIELHLSHIVARETFRASLITARKVDGLIEGLGRDSYVLALLALDKLIQRE